MPDPTQPAAGQKPSAADAMISVGVLVTAVAICFLAGFWWALLFEGLAMIVGGVIKARSE